MAMINSKCLNNTGGTPKLLHHKLITHKPTTITTTKVTEKNANVSTTTSISMTGAIFASLGSSDSAFAAQQIAEGSDNRGLALLLPLIPAIAWVLFNILQPALNQINRMRSTRGLIVGLGGLLAGSGEAWASEMGMIGDAAAAGGSDNRGQLLLFVVAPAIVWVLYNILQPALNQLNRMRSQ